MIIRRLMLPMMTTTAVMIIVGLFGDAAMAGDSFLGGLFGGFFISSYRHSCVGPEVNVWFFHRNAG